MSPRTLDTVTAAPMRRWLGEQLELLDRTYDSPMLVLAGKLGMSERRLRDWRDPDRARFDRRSIEDALHRAGIQIWELYPELVPDGAEVTHGWCPTCREESPIDPKGNCLWCSTQTGASVPVPEPAPRPKRSWVVQKGMSCYGPECPECGGPKGKQSMRCRRCWYAAGRPRRGGKGPRPSMRIPHCIRLEDLEAARRLYSTGLSLRQVAAQIHPRTEYKTVASCAEGLYSLFKTRGWKLRPQPAVTAARNFKHGRKRRDLTPAEEQAYRRFLRDERGWNSIQGPGQPQCKGTKSQPPRKGSRCIRHAMDGSEYCNVHDPARQRERQEICARMRARQPTREMVSLEPFARWLERLYVELGTYSALAEHLGCSTSRISDLLARRACRNGGPREPISDIDRAAVERYLKRDGSTSFDALYGDPTEAIAA